MAIIKITGDVVSKDSSWRLLGAFPMTAAATSTQQRFCIDGMGWDGRNGMGRDGMGWDGAEWDGMESPGLIPIFLVVLFGPICSAVR